MGVHDAAATAKAKELLGIPAGEPVFILRAQDVLYTATIAAYEALYIAAVKADQTIRMGDEHWFFTDHLDACRDNGRVWQRKNKERVKIPD